MTTLEQRIAEYLGGGWGLPPRKEREGECEWYALSTAPRQERTVSAGLAERGYAFFLPMETVHQGSPPQLHMEPLWPGYVFVLCSPEDFADVVGVETSPSFVRYVRADGVAWPVVFPAQVILGLQIQERAGAYDRTRDHRPPAFRPRKGDAVLITAGDYYGFVATVLATPQGDRCKLLIQHESFSAPRNRTEDVAHLTAA
jgi:transcription antitermination factor NusG